MKFLLATAISFVSLSSFACGVEQLASYLPVGTYSGVNDQGVACQVYVKEVNYPKKDLQVRVVAGGIDLSKLVQEGSVGRCRGAREFDLTERSLVGSDDSNYVERIIRTVSAGDNKQYVVVSYSTIMNTDRNDQIAECVVDL